MSSALDGVLKDLELACGSSQHKSAPRSPPTSTTATTSSHLETRSPSTSTSERSSTWNEHIEAGKFTNLSLNEADLRKFHPPPVPERKLSSKMATTVTSNNAVTNNLNELDVLLQDLSNARFSGNNGSSSNSKIMEQQKSESMMTTSSSVSYQSSSGFYPSDYNRPRSGGSKSPAATGIIKTPLEDAVIREMSSKLNERHEESSQNYITSSTTEQKWEYVGQGIWENGHPTTTATTNGNHIDFTKKQPSDKLNLTTTTTGNSSYHQSSRSRGQASSATQELDDLMQSLNTFKLKEKIDEPVNTHLDDIMCKLQEDMVKQGVKTTPKGVCAVSGKPIFGPMVTALGQTFLPQCFTCAHCNMELATQNFFERNGKPYCEKCYHFLALKGSLCAGCSKPISGRCIIAMFRKFHPEHFVCSFCLKQLNKGTFKEKGEKPYCHECFNRLFG